MYNKLNKLWEAPLQGYLLAYFQKKVIFNKYSIKENPSEILEAFQDECLLELHMFDEKKEYRAILSRRKDGYIETIVSDELEENDIMEENVFLNEMTSGVVKEEKAKITVVNYLSFDENDDLMRIENYRLKIESIEGGVTSVQA